MSAFADVILVFLFLAIPTATRQEMREHLLFVSL